MSASYFNRISARQISVLFILFFAAESTIAADAAKLETFMTTNACKYFDLTSAALIGKDMRGADFQNANLRKAGLSGANLKGAILKDARLDSIKLEEGKFCNTNMPDGSMNDTGC